MVISQSAVTMDDLVDSNYIDISDNREINSKLDDLYIEKIN